MGSKHFAWARDNYAPHQMGHLPEQFDGVLDGKTEEELIQGHMRLAMQVAGHYGGSDEVISAALFGLVKAVRRWNKVRNDDNITRYLTVVMHGHCLKALRERQVIKVPETSRKRHDIKLPELTSEVEPPARETISVELQEVLQIVSVTAKEKQILALRWQGFNDKEIGEKLSMSLGRVNQIRSDLKEKFIQKWNLS